jgi:hypothetical protein
MDATSQPPVTAQNTSGQIAYEAYGAQANGVSLVSGAELPPWHGLPASIRDAWESAGQAVIDSTVPERTP